jgi:hypothetical protein
LGGFCFAPNMVEHALVDAMNQEVGSEAPIDLRHHPVGVPGRALKQRLVSAQHAKVELAATLLK